MLKEDISMGAKESIMPGDKVLFLNFYRDDERYIKQGRNYKITYHVKDAKDLTDDNKEEIKSMRRQYIEPGCFYSMTYKKSFPDDPNQQAKVIMISDKWRIERTIDEYKSVYGKRFKEIPEISPETEKHFGDIMANLGESKSMVFDKIVNLLLEELKIVAPAVKLPSGKVIAGRKGDMHANVHDRIINRLAAINNVSQEAAANRFYKVYGEKKFLDGFIDSEGNFQTREDAWDIQKKYDKKIADRDVELSNKEGGDEFKRLSSEWIPKEITGY